MPSVIQRFRSGWNAFLGRNPTNVITREGPGIEYYSYAYRPDRARFSRGNERSIVASIYNRIAIDVSAISFEHAMVDENGAYTAPVDSGLNNCLNISANTDQTGKALLQDLVQSMFDEGCVAVVPTDTHYAPTELSERFNILELRVGRITQWYPSEVMVHLYNERTGRYQDVRLPKSSVAIIENPFYATMNEPNSTLQRLVRTINKQDDLNSQTASGKLDLIIQLPYVVRSEQRRIEANQRRKELESQLAGSKYGVAWTDGTEHVTQLNRSLENNLWEQVKDLTAQLYNQLYLTQAVLDGSADETVMINYFNNTIAPICSAICDEFKRKFLSKTARSQGQSVVFFRDPFKLVPVAKLAEIADKFRRNEIMTSNELRAEIGFRPSKSEKAETLDNPNLNQSKEAIDAQNGEADASGAEEDINEMIGGSQDG